MSRRERSSTRATCSAVVASSQATDTWSASTRQMLMPRLASACTAAARLGTCTQHGVEERVVHHLEPGRGEPGSQRAGVAVHGGRSPAGRRAVVAGVHRRQHRQQHLAVQMFEVALSRRMCCSRVCSDNR